MAYTAKQTILRTLIFFSPDNDDDVTPVWRPTRYGRTENNTPPSNPRLARSEISCRIIFFWIRHIPKLFYLKLYFINFFFLDETLLPGKCVSNAREIFEFVTFPWARLGSARGKTYLGDATNFEHDTRIVKIVTKTRLADVVPCFFLRGTHNTFDDSRISIMRSVQYFPEQFWISINVHNSEQSEIRRLYSKYRIIVDSRIGSEFRVLFIFPLACNVVRPMAVRRTETWRSSVVNRTCDKYGIVVNISTYRKDYVKP